jgi:DNA-binding MarR family transcriptional regulator
MTETRDIPGLCFATNARMAARALTRRYDNALRPHGLRVTQFALLVAAELSGGERTITEIADALGLERSTLSRGLAPLERRGLVALGPETQHRARHMDITAEGRALLARARADWEAVQAATEAALGADAGRVRAALARLAALGH